MEEDDKPHWTVDRRIPMVFVLAMVMQTIALVYVGTTWKSDIDHRITDLEKFSNTVADSRPVNLNRITILEQQFIALQQSQGRIERTLEKILNK